MTKFARSLALLAAMAAVITAGGAAAQDKKDAKGTKGTKSAAGGTIEINEGKDGKYRFSIRDADGKYLGGNAVGQETREDAVKAVEMLKDVLPNAKVVAGKKDDKEKGKKDDKKDDKGKEKGKEKGDK